MKKIMSKIIGSAGFAFIYLFAFSSKALAVSNVSVPESNMMDQLYAQLMASENMLIVLGIAAVLPAIICLLIAYFSDKKSDDGGRSILGWFGITIVLAIPLVSLIMLFIWAFGEKTKSDPTFRNYARLILLTYLYSIIFVVTYIAGTMLLVA